MSCQEICEQYVVMGNYNLLMRRRFKFWVSGLRNVSIETWIKAAKFNPKSQSVLKIWTKCWLNFHKVEYFHEVECTWVRNFFSWIFRESKIFFSWLFRRSKIFFMVISCTSQTAYSIPNWFKELFVLFMLERYLSY